LRAMSGDYLRGHDWLASGHLSHSSLACTANLT
jgi:hypothetical protein